MVGRLKLALFGKRRLNLALFSKRRQTPTYTPIYHQFLQKKGGKHPRCLANGGRFELISTGTMVSFPSFNINRGGETRNKAKRVQPAEESEDGRGAV